MATNTGHKGRKTINGPTSRSRFALETEKGKMGQGYLEAAILSGTSYSQILNTSRKLKNTNIRCLWGGQEVAWTWK